MMTLRNLGVSAVVLFFLGSAVTAHQMTKDPVVLARMDLMHGMASNAKRLSQLIKDKSTFSSEEAAKLAMAIAASAQMTPRYFEKPADDPSSEALPLIWAQFGEFTDHALRLEKVARKAAGHMQSSAQAEKSLLAIADACKSCHATFRE